MSDAGQRLDIFIHVVPAPADPFVHHQLITIAQVLEQMVARLSRLESDLTNQTKLVQQVTQVREDLAASATELNQAIDANPPPAEAGK